MSDSLRPHPWDSPGKNTGVGCHFLLQCMKVKSESEVAQSCLTLHDLKDCSLPGSSVHGIFQARVLEWGAIAFSKTKPYNPAISLLSIYKEKGVPRLNKKLCTDAFITVSSITAKKLEIIQMSLNSRIDKERTIHTTECSQQRRKPTNATCCRHMCSEEARHKSTSPEIPFTRSSSTGKTLVW